MSTIGANRTFPPLTWGSVIAHVVPAGLVYCFDALFLGQGIAICLVAAVAVIVALSHVVGGLFGARSRILRGFMIAVVWSGAAYGAVMTVAADRRSAKLDAEQVARALQAYRKANGTYPSDLKALVPDFLPTIPPGREHTMWLPGLRYIYDGSHGHLTYTSLPPVQRRFLLPEEVWVSTD